MGSQERRKREKELRREYILDTARDLLFQKGINAATMNQIARNAELSVGTLYLYFKNKEDLYAALQEEGLDILRDMIAEVAAGDAEPLRCFSIRRPRCSWPAIWSPCPGPSSTPPARHDGKPHSDAWSRSRSKNSFPATARR